MTETRESCYECKYYSRGDCHRHPPQVAIMSRNGEASQIVTFYPEVGITDWCGEFQPAEPIELVAKKKDEK